MQTATDFRFNAFDMMSDDDSAKYVIFTTADKKGNETDDKIKVSMNEELIRKSLELAGYNMLVTSEIAMSDKDAFDAYNNLWRIQVQATVLRISFHLLHHRNFSRVEQ